MGARLNRAAYIVGTSHRIQCGVKQIGISKEIIRAFQSEITKICRQYGIRRVCEEMSEDGLREHGVAETICCQVARKSGIEHRYIDLGRECRSYLSLNDLPPDWVLWSENSEEVKQFRNTFGNLIHQVRERIWVARILFGESWPVLFICGAEHTDPVHRLLNEFDIESEILFHDLGS